MVFLPMNALPGVPPVAEYTPPAYYAHGITIAENSEVFVVLDLYGPNDGESAFWHFGYLPYTLWVGEDKWWDVPADDNDQILVKFDVIEKISGIADDPIVEVDTTRGLEGQWLDIWDYWEFQLVDEHANGIPEHWIVDISWADDDGFGSPTGTVTTKRINWLAYYGVDDYIIYTQFNDADGTDLEDATDTLNKYGEDWVAHSGTIEVTNGIARVESVGGALYSIDAGEADGQIDLRVDRTNYSGGPVGRLVDEDNYWRLSIEDRSLTDPSLELQKVVAGVVTVVDSYELTGVGPLALSDDRTMRLHFDGNNIAGYAQFHYPEWDADNGGNAGRGVPTVSASDGTFNTATKYGMWSDDQSQWFNDVSVTKTYPGFNPIVWDTSALTSSVTDTGTVTANIYFYETSKDSSGHSSAGYYNSGSIAYEDVVRDQCTSFSTGDFLIYVEAVSGDTADVDLYEGIASRSFDTWFDLFRANVTLDAPVSTSKSAVVDITVAIDDGTGSPSDAYPTVVKRVTLSPTSTGP